MRTIMHALAFDMIQTDRGWVPHYSVAIDGKRICIKGPALATYTANIERTWRERLADQARRFQDGARHDLIQTAVDDLATYYACPMIATVTSVENGIVRARVRRNSRDEGLYNRHYDLKVGDRVEVKRQTNNPFLVRVEE